MLNREIERYIKANEDEALALLKQLARIPAPSNREEKRARFCLEWLRTQGAEGVYCDDALNVIYPVEADAEGPLEVYAAHMDVVFPDETELPLREENGRIYCPGVGDDTACLVCLLMAAKYIAEHRLSGIWKQLRGSDAPGLLLVCNTGEEGLGNLRGIREICRVYGPRIRSFCTFDARFDHIVNRAVGSKRYRITLDTKGGHSFGDFGADNAIERLSRLIQRLYRIEVPKAGHTTYNVGTITGGTSINTIAQHAEMLYEFRSDTAAYLSYMEERFLEALEEEKKRGSRIGYELLGERPCGSAVDEMLEKKLVRRAVSAIRSATGIVPAAGAGSTDCNIPLSMGIPSVCVGCYEGQGAHTREEYVETASLRKGYRVAFDMIFGREE